MSNEVKIKHALRYSWLNKIYDTITAFTCREEYFKYLMINISKDKLQAPVLDIACGTGTFIKMLLNTTNNIKIIGLDADENILAIAKKKLNNFNDIEYITAYSNETKLSEATIGTAFSSLFFHHLSLKAKYDTTKEIFRILKKGSNFIIADWGKPDNYFMSVGFFFLRAFDGFDTTRDNLDNKIPEIMLNCGFSNVIEKAKVNTIFGTLRIWQGTKQ